MSRTEVKSLTVAREKIAAVFAIYAPSIGHDAALSALGGGLAEFEAAVREDEHDAITYAGGAPLANVPTGTSALDTSEADAIEPPRESTPEEVAKVYAQEMPAHFEPAPPPPIPPTAPPSLDDVENLSEGEQHEEDGAVHPSQLSPLA